VTRLVCEGKHHLTKNITTV